MSDEQPALDAPDLGQPIERQEFRGPGDWKAQADKVENPNPVWDLPDE